MKSVVELRELLDSKKVTNEELFKESNFLAHSYQDKINAFVTILDTYSKEDSNSILNGIPYALKDNYSTKGILSTASSNILKDYIPVYDSTVYKKLKESGAVLIGKTVLDELAMGATGTTGHTGIVKNPWDVTRTIAGSSSGSAAAVAQGIVPFAIGSDTGDSVRKPAAFGGIVGFKPTYGRISRYGLFAFASSLDHVGYFTRSVKDTAIITDILKGKDIYDMTTLDDDNKSYTSTLDYSIKNKKLFYFKDICDSSYYKDITIKRTLDMFKDTITKLKDIGFIIEEIDFDKELLRSMYPAYNIISCAESTSNNANLTGIQFGPRAIGDNINEMIFNARTQGFSELIKRRFVLGSYILQKENQEKLFLNAGRVRRMLVDKINKIFEDYDGLIMPAASGIAPHFDDAFDRLSDEYLILENHLVLGNFGGFPSITLPSGFIDNMPIAINVTGRQLEDDLVLNMAYKMEECLGYKGIVAGGDNDV